jgi:hypothetical protein
MTDTMPPLPAIVQRADAHYSGEGLADAVRAYALAAMQAERERCAAILDANAQCCDGLTAELFASNAAAIRAG